MMASGSLLQRSRKTAVCFLVDFCRDVAKKQGDDLITIVMNLMATNMINFLHNSNKSDQFFHNDEQSNQFFTTVIPLNRG